MHEIIHLSLSSRSNHIHSHFYNAQESYFVYDDTQVKDSNVDPSILFQQGKGYTPRGVLWDMKGGFGSLATYSGPYTPEIKHTEQCEKNDFDSSLIWGQQGQVEMHEKAIERSQYQINLDQGKPLPKLNAANTTYWSDYLNSSLHPRSLQSLSNWEYDPVAYPNGRLRGQSSITFMSHDAGIEEYKSLNDDKEYLETTFRPFLENCDLISGVSLTTEVHTGWGGFSCELLAELRDDFIPKLPLFVWANGPNNGKKQAAKISEQNISIARAACKLIDFSSLYIPLSLDPHIPLEYIQERSLNSVDLHSQWGSAAFSNTAFESLSVLSSLRHFNRISMQTIVDNLVGGSNRNIVSAVATSISQHWIDLSISDSVESPYFFKKAAVKRGPVEDKSIPHNSEQGVTNFGILDIRNPWNSVARDEDAVKKNAKEDIYHSFISQSEDDSDVQVEFHCSQKFNSIPSLPVDMIRSDDRVCSYFGVTNQPREELRQMAELISKTKLNDREELKEDLYNTAQEYETGWISEDELDI